MGWLFLLYRRQNLVLSSFTSKTFLIYSSNLVMDSICCLCLGCPSEQASSFISVFIKDDLVCIILCNSHLPLASSYMTDLPLLWPFFLCILQADLYIYMWMFGVGNWNWPEEKKNRWCHLSVFSITGVCMGGSCLVNSSVYLQIGLADSEADTEGTHLVISIQLSHSSLGFLSPLLPIVYQFQSQFGNLHVY